MNPLSDHKPTIGIIGAGQVGRAFATALLTCGYQIAAVFSRTPEHAAALAQQTGSRVAVSAADVLTSSDLTLFTVSDDAIEILANEAAGQVGGLLATKKLRLSSRHRAVIHTSGAHDRQALVALQRMGWLTGSLHPALPFTGADYATPEHFSGAGFALEADDEQLFDWMERIAQALGASAFRLKQGQKALYHAALAMTSNYTVTLYAFAEHLLTTAGLSEAAAESTLNALLHATLTNLEREGIPDALTGPLVRNDTGTLQRHLRVLRDDAPEGVSAYRALARLTYPLLTARGISTLEIEHLLQQDESSWQD